MSRLQKYVTDAKTVSMLQEPIITQRDGRYVIPLRAEFKGKIKSIEPGAVNLMTPDSAYCKSPQSSRRTTTIC